MCDRSYACHANSPAIQGWFTDPTAHWRWARYCGIDRQFDCGESEEDEPDIPKPTDPRGPPRTPSSLPVFHYTDVYDLPRFLYTGVIDIWPHHDQPQHAWVAWFSTNPLWERSSAVALGRAETVGACGRDRNSYLDGAARIRVRPEAAPYEWARFFSWCGYDDYWLEKWGRNERETNGSNPSEWYVSPSPVLASDWMAVEVWDAKRWQWISITESDDRQLCDLIPLLPRHLVPDDIKTGATWAMTDGSPVSLRNIPAALRLAGLPISPPYGDGGEFDRIMERFTLVREAWKECCKLADLGIQLIPLDPEGRVIRASGCRQPSADREQVTSWWLGKYHGAACGMLLPETHFALRGDDRVLDCCGAWGGVLPRTTRIREVVVNRDKGGHSPRITNRSILLFRSYPALSVPGEPIQLTGDHGVEYVPPGAVCPCLGFYARGNLTHQFHLESCGEIAKAPPWLLALVRRVGRRA